MKSLIEQARTLGVKVFTHGHIVRCNGTSLSHGIKEQSDKTYTSWSYWFEYREVLGEGEYEWLSVSDSRPVFYKERSLVWEDTINELIKYVNLLQAYADHKEEEEVEAEDPCFVAVSYIETVIDNPKWVELVDYAIVKGEKYDIDSALSKAKELKHINVHIVFKR